MDISEFTVENMKPLVGTTWRIDAGDRTIELHLSDVVKTLDQHVDARFQRDSFSLQFRGSRDVYLPQATYVFHHDEVGGPHYIFIVPTSKDAEGYRYEAVFT